MSKKVQYYHYKNANVGERFFKVRFSKDVVQIITDAKKKKGRAYMRGITLIKYITFISSWGWALEHRLQLNKAIKLITKEEFESEFDKMVEKLKNK